MDPRQLEYFVQVVAQRGFNRAAAHLNIAQSALSRRIGQLEDELGVALLLRTGHGVQVTAAGKLLLAKAEVLLRHFRDVREEVMAQADVPGGELVLGFPPSLQAMIAVPVLQTLRQRHPSVFVRVWVATSMVLKEQVLSGKVDLAVIGVVEPETVLGSEMLFSDDMFLLGRLGPHMAGQRSVGWAELAKLPLILTTQPNSVRLLVDRAAAKARKTLNVVMEVNYVPVLIDLVRRGMGFTLLPRSAVHDLVGAGDLAAVQVRDLRYTWAVVGSKEKPLSAAGRAARALILEAASRRAGAEDRPEAASG